MLIRNLNDCKLITASDQTSLRELLHPDREYAFPGRYSLAHATLPPGRASLPHRLAASEVYYLLGGRGRLHVGDEAAVVSTGCAVSIPPGSVQWIENIGETELSFLCIVDPSWCAEDEEILDG